MNCPSDTTLRQRYCQQVAAADADAIDLHVDGCPICQQRANELIDGSLSDRPTTDSAEMNTSPPLMSNAPPDFLAPPQAPDELGRLGPYRVLSVLGTGGMGMVFLAEDPQLGRQVALKVIRPEHAADPVAKQRFIREARAVAAVDHRHVVPIHHVGEDNGVAFLEMPLLKGQTLATALKENPRPALVEVVRIGREMAEGLAAAHRQHIVHRDVKPGNVWLEGEERWVRLLDFGLARPEEGTGEPLTAFGAFVGTPNYVSPEQARGEGVSAAGDLFSLGVVLYQMATGTLPFAGPSPMAFLTAQATKQPEPPTGLPPALRDLIMRLLAKTPADRPASTLEVVRVLESVQLDSHQHSGTDVDARVAGAGVFGSPGAGVTHSGASKTPPRPHAEAGVGPSGASKTPPRPHGKRRRSMAIALVAALLIVGGGAALTVVIIRDKDGKEVARVKVPDGGSVTVEPDKPAKEEVKKPARAEIEPQPFEWRKGAPLFATALVQRPEAIKGLASWTLAPQGHEDHVVSIAYRPDGAQLASCSLDGTVRIHEATTGRLLHALTGHETVWDVAWTRDGRYLASAGGLTVNVWNPKTGQLLKTYTFEVPCGSVDWTIDGKILVIGCSDGKIRFQNVVAGAPCPILEGHKSSVIRIRLSPDGKTLASGSEDRTIRTWNLATGRALKVMSGHEVGVGIVGWSHDGSLLASAGSGDRSIHIWDAGSGKLIRLLESQASVSWSPKEKVLAYFANDGVRLWSALSGKERKIIDQSWYAQSLAWSPDGKTLVGAGHGFDLSLTCWDAQTGEVLLAIPGRTSLPRDHLQSIAWSPDGSRFACPGETGAVTIWHADSGHRVLALPPIQWNANRVAWSADSKRLAVVYADSPDVHLWDLTTGKLAEKLTGHTQGLSWVAWSSDGKTLASASKDRTVRLWDGASGKHLRTLEGHTARVSALAWSWDDKHLASCSSDGTVRLWQADSGKSVAILDAKAGPVHAVAWSSDDRTVASGGEDGIVRWWDAESGKQTEKLTGHTAAIRSLSWSADGKTLASAGQAGDQTLRLWDGQTGEFLRGVTVHRTGADVAWSPDGKTLTAAGWDGRVHFFDADAKLRATLLTPEVGPALLVGANGHFRGPPGASRGFVVTALTERGEQQTLSLKEFAEQYGWKNDPSQVQPLGRPAGPVPGPPRTVPYELKPGEPRNAAALVQRPAAIKGVRSWTIETRGHRGHTLVTAYSPDGTNLATGGADGTIRICDATGRLRRILMGHGGPVCALAWSPDGTTLASSSNEDQTWPVRFWDPKSGWLLRTLRVGNLGNVHALAWSPDGKTLAISDYNRGVWLWDTGSWEPVARLARGGAAAYCLAWSSDGRVLAGAGGDSRSCQLWDPESGTLIRTLRGHTQGVRSLAWLPDGERVVSGGDDRVLRLWDARSGKVLQQREGHGNPIYGVAWSADGRRIVSVSPDSIRVWDAKPLRLLYSMPGFGNYVYAGAASFSPNCRTVAVAIAEAGAVILNAESGQQQKVIAPQTSRVVAAWAPDRKVLAIAGIDGKITLRSAPLGEVLHVLTGHGAWIPDLAWSPDGLMLASVIADSTVRLWDGRRGKCLHTFKELRTPLDYHSLAWSPDGKRLACGTGNELVLVWEAVTGKLQQTLRGNRGVLARAAWSPKGDRLALCSGAIYIHETKEWKRVATWAPEPSVGVSAWAPDGRTLAYGVGNPLGLMDVGNGKVLASQWGWGAGGQMSWSPDGKSLLCGGGDGVIHRWDIAGGKDLVRVHQHAGLLVSLARSLDGKTAMSASWDGSVRFWDAATGRAHGLLQCLQDNRELIISPEGHYRGTPGVERYLVYVVLTDKGEQETLTPAELAKKYGWKNDPERVRSLVPAAQEKKE